MYTRHDVVMELAIITVMDITRLDSGKGRRGSCQVDIGTIRAHLSISICELWVILELLGINVDPETGCEGKLRRWRIQMVAFLHRHWKMDEALHSNLSLARATATASWARGIMTVALPTNRLRHHEVHDSITRLFYISNVYETFLGFPRLMYHQSTDANIDLENYNGSACVLGQATRLWLKFYCRMVASSVPTHLTNFAMT